MSTETNSNQEPPRPPDAGCSTVRLPAVGDHVRMYGTLIEVQDVTPKVEVQHDYIFEDTDARLEMRINGKIVDRVATFNNFYGKDTCVEAAIQEAKEKMRWYGESSMEFVVVKITSRQRMRPDRGQREHFYDSQFRAMSALEYGSKKDLPDDIEEDVWSSLNQ